MDRRRRSIECPKCGYKWEQRVINPKRCPRCGKWLIPKPIKITEGDLK